MFRFVIKVIIFSIIFLLLILSGFLIPDKAGYENMHYSIYDKHELFSKKKAPRIILVGGSNFSFGAYSPHIIDSMDMEVINTSIHGGYGLKYMIDDVLPYIQENDIVIISPEYESFYGNDFYGNEVLVQLIDAYPKALLSLSIKQFYLHVGDFCTVAILKWRAYLSSFFKDHSPRKTGPYERTSFNEYGDVILHWDKQNEMIKSKEIAGEFNSDAIDYLSEFNKALINKKAQLFVTFPSLNKNSFNKNESKINQVQQSFHEKKIRLLGTPLKFSFPDSLYFDSRYHLNKEGQFKRTSLLINELKKQFN